MSILKSFRKSFSNRVIGAFLLVLLFMILLYLGIFRTGYSMLTNEISKLLYTKTSFYVENLEEEIQRIQKLQNECLNDDTLYYTSGAFSIMTKSEQTKRLLELQSRLKTLHESSTYIAEAYVYIPELNRKISSIDGVELVESITPELTYMQEKSRYSLPFYYQGVMHLGASYPYNMVNTDSVPNFTLVIRLSDSKIQETLNFLSEYPDSGVKLTDRGGAYELNVGQNINLSTVKNTDEQLLQKVTDQRNLQEYLVFNIFSSFLDMDVYAYISSNTVYNDLYIYRALFIACFITVMILMIFYIYSMYIFINSPINTLVKTIEQMEIGDLSVRITENREDEFRRVYDAFNHMAESLQTQMEINYQQKLLTQQAELRHLQSQINPHFLYNSFFSIYRMAKDEDCESIVELSSYLSEYYRYITKSAQSDTELGTEVQHARRYAQIQAMRFKRRLSVDFSELPDEYKDIPVPRLILQPILENAFDHGLNNTEKGGILRIWYEKREDKLFINVQDNGSGMSDQELDILKASFMQTSASIENGLCNINRRLKIKFGKEYGIEIHAQEKQGTLCCLILPIHNWEKEEGNV